MQHTLDRSLVRYSVATFFILAMILGAGTVYLVVQGILPSGVALASALSASIAGIMAVHTSSGDFSLMHGRCRQQRRGSASFVDIGETTGPSRTQGKLRLGAVQSLDLRLLIHREHKGVIRRIKVQSHNHRLLLFKLGIRTCAAPAGDFMGISVPPR